jgi:mRNA-degrading endonuclease RelE of RelBE toxin-antitoxin system
VTVRYSDTFKRQLKRLSRKYRHIRSDIQPFIEQMKPGKHPVIRFRARATPFIKFDWRIPMCNEAKVVAIRAIYYMKQQDDILLVTLYSKTEQADIEAGEVIHIIQEEA